MIQNARCGCCGEGVLEGGISCPRCDSRLHRECSVFLENDCTRYGCASSVREQEEFKNPVYLVKRGITEQKKRPAPTGLEVLTEIFSFLMFGDARHPLAKAVLRTAMGIEFPFSSYGSLPELYSLKR